MDAGRLSLMCLRIATSREEKAQRRRHGWGRAYLWHVPHPIFDFMTRERLFPLDNLRFPSIIISIYMIPHGLYRSSLETRKSQIRMLNGVKLEESSSGTKIFFFLVKPLYHRGLWLRLGLEKESTVRNQIH